MRDIRRDDNGDKGRWYIKNGDKRGKSAWHQNQGRALHRGSDHHIATEIVRHK